MDSLVLLSDVLEDKIHNQTYYNDSAIKVRNPEARQMLLKFRDEEMKHIEILQKEIVSIENKPFIVTQMLNKLKS